MRARDRIRSERKRVKKLAHETELQQRIQRARHLLAQAHGPTERDKIIEALQNDPEAYHAILPEIPHIRSAWDSPEPRNTPVRKWGYDNARGEGRR